MVGRKCAKSKCRSLSAVANFLWRMVVSVGIFFWHIMVSAALFFVFILFWICSRDSDKAAEEK